MGAILTVYRGECQCLGAVRAQADNPGYLPHPGSLGKARHSQPSGDTSPPSAVVDMLSADEVMRALLVDEELSPPSPERSRPSAGSPVTATPTSSSICRASHPGRSDDSTTSRTLISPPLPPPEAAGTFMRDGSPGVAPRPDCLIRTTFGVTSQPTPAGDLPEPSWPSVKTLTSLP